MEVQAGSAQTFHGQFEQILTLGLAGFGVRLVSLLAFRP